MRKREFEFGPIATGSFLALVCVLGPIIFAFPQWAFSYILFLLFLGLGLRILLERSGLYRFWSSVEGSLVQKWNRRFLAKRKSEVDRKMRDEKYRKSRYRDPRLPKNW
jgi:hypothetical protein